MHIEDWSLAKIRPYPNNPRVLRNAAEKVAESIKAFGWRQPIVVDADGVVIVGHSRLEAAKLLKLKKVPVHVAKDLTPDQVRALRIADNKTATFAEWDDAKLTDELAEIMAGLGSVATTGFSQSEFEALEMAGQAELARLQTPAKPPAPEIPENEALDPADTAQDATNLGVDEPENPELPPARPADLVPFNVLMTVDNRQVVYDAVARAKQRHQLATTADALLVICRSYVDA